MLRLYTGAWLVTDDTIKFEENPKLDVYLLDGEFPEEILEKVIHSTAAVLAAAEVGYKNDYSKRMLELIEKFSSK